MLWNLLRLNWMKTKIAVFDKMDGSAREGSPDEDNEGKLKKILKKDLNSIQFL